MPVPDSARRIVNQERSSPGSRSLPFFDRSGSVHADRLKQQGRLFPLCIFEMLTSTRRLRVSGFFVASTQRTHSQRAIGVISFHRFWIFCGAATRAVARSWGTLGSGQSLVTSMSRVAASPALMPAACRSVSSTLIQWPVFPSGSSTVWNSTPLIVPWTATCPREGSPLLAASGNRNTVDLPIADSVASKRTAAPSVRSVTTVSHLLRSGHGTPTLTPSSSASPSTLYSESSLTGRAMINFGKGALALARDSVHDRSGCEAYALTGILMHRSERTYFRHERATDPRLHGVRRGWRAAAS